MESCSKYSAMSVTRVDPLTGFRVVVAPGRRKIGASRPAGLPQPTARCPFCPGHEADTEASLLEIGAPWRVRVVANRFPLIDGERGAHEVLIEHREHDVDLAGYAPEHAREVLSAAQQRISALEARARSVVFFRNRGRRAGSSQPHPHAQIVALPEVTPSAATRARRAEDPANALGAVIEREARAPVAIEGAFSAWCPPASERAFHVRLASPRWPRFSAIDDEGIAALAVLLPRVIRAALEVSGTSDYNLLLRDPPVGDERGPSFFDLLPRTGGDAGFELGSQIGVCTVEPSEAASEMRARLSSRER